MLSSLSKSTGLLSTKLSLYISSASKKSLSLPISFGYHLLHSGKSSYSIAVAGYGVDEYARKKIMEEFAKNVQ